MPEGMRNESAMPRGGGGEQGALPSDVPTGYSAAQPVGGTAAGGAMLAIRSRSLSPCML